MNNIPYLLQGAGQALAQLDVTYGVDFPSFTVSILSIFGFKTFTENILVLKAFLIMIYFKK